MGPSCDEFIRLDWGHIFLRPPPFHVELLICPGRKYLLLLELESFEWMTRCMCILYQSGCQKHNTWRLDIWKCHICTNLMRWKDHFIYIHLHNVVPVYIFMPFTHAVSIQIYYDMPPLYIPGTLWLKLAFNVFFYGCAKILTEEYFVLQ